MKITNLKFKNGFFDIYTENGLLCTLSDETVFKLKLKSGMELDDDTSEKLYEMSDFETAKRDGAYLLSRSANTRYSFCTKLKLKGHSRQAAEYAADFFEKNGFIDDLKYAKAYAADSVRLKQDGKNKIICNLIKKGVSRDIIDEALNETEFDGALERLAEKELKKLKDRDRKSIEKVKRRLYAKGFGIGEINEVMSRLGGEDFEI